MVSDEWGHHSMSAYVQVTTSTGREVTIRRKAVDQLITAFNTDKYCFVFLRGRGSKDYIEVSGSYEELHALIFENSPKKRLDR